MPTHVEVGEKNGLEKNSVVLLEQIRTIDKQRIKDKVTQLKKEKMKEIDDALRISIGLSNKYKYI
ncbi:mRNA interferase EndoA [Alloiococcus otitis]|nr:mRNA interferase EndoA [Alloiococcus otitis]